MLADIIKHLHPSVIIGEDCHLQDDSDGKGPYIVFWNDAKLGPKPTVSEIEAAWPTVEADINAKETQKAEIDQVIASDTTIKQLKNMTNSEFDTWWSNNVSNTAQAIAVLKRITRVVLRKVL